MTKPKGKTPSLLSRTNGRPESFVSKKKSNCVRCKAPIYKDTKGFRIPTIQSGFVSKRPFCLDCFGQIIEQTKKELSAIEQEWLATNGIPK